MKQMTICSIFLLLSLSTFAQHAIADKKTDNYIHRQMLDQHIIGVSVAIVQDGKIIKASGYGQADIENNVPATASTVYKIASVSKQFLAAGVLILQQDGKLNITDAVSHYIPGVPETWKNMTLQRLLNHSAGLPLDVPAFDPYRVQADSTIIKSLFTAPLLFAPGDSISYSNAGYFVIAEVISRVSGLSWDEFITKRIFQPLKMSDTRATNTTMLVKNRSHGYVVKNGMTTNAEEWIALRPSGAFLSTVKDMAKWDAALYGNAILTADSKHQLWSPVKFNNGGALSYALGWNITPFQGHNRVFHDGGLPGFSTFFERFVDERLTVIVLCNTEGQGIDTGKLASDIAGFYNQKLQLKTK